jgi:excisionase family DNA binding protein
MSDDPNITALPVLPAPVKPRRKRKPYVPTGRPPGRPKGSPNRNRAPEAVVPAIKPRALQINRAAGYADVSVSTMRKWIRDGLVPTTRIGAVILIPLATLDALLDGRRL